jgi:3-oxoacyl-[acyl-carrier-protein] synthase II
LISSTKGKRGHLLGAAGTVEIVLTILGLERRKLPPSTNIFNLDEEFKGINCDSFHSK